jgi:hypothetical protein
MNVVFTGNYTGKNALRLCLRRSAFFFVDNSFQLKNQLRGHDNFKGSSEEINYGR